jgi:hypothetical protein
LSVSVTTVFSDDVVVRPGRNNNWWSDDVIAEDDGEEEEVTSGLGPGLEAILAFSCRLVFLVSRPKKVQSKIRQSRREPKQVPNAMALADFSLIHHTLISRAHNGPSPCKS